MKKTLLILYLCVLSMSHGKLFAHNMYVLILADDADKHIGKAVEKNIYNFEYSFSKISDALENSLHVVKLTSGMSTLTRNNIMNWIRNIHPTVNDIVVVYYSGHGLRKTDTISHLPAGHIPNENRNIWYVDFAKITKRIMRKKAGLNLILLDCCNLTSQPWPLISKEVKPYAPFDVKEINMSTRKNSLIKLFKLKGVIVASGCSPNEVSWANYPRASPEWPDIYENPSAGSVFSKFFLHNLLLNPSTLNSNFDSILLETKKHCVTETQNNTAYRFLKPPQSLKHTYQTPQFKICLHKKQLSYERYKRFIFENTANEPLGRLANKEQDEVIEYNDDIDMNLIFATPGYSLFHMNEYEK